MSSRILPPEIIERPDGLYVIADCNQSVIFPKDRVTVKEAVEVRGDVRALIAEIIGTVHGNVEAGHAELRKGGQLVGDIRTARFVIEDGAYFKGSIDVAKAG